MPRVTKEVHEEHIAACEQAMISLRSAFRVEQDMTRRFGVNPRTARKWMQMVRARWAAEAAKDDPGLGREARRVEMDRTLNEVLAAAMNRTIIVKDKDGNPILDGNGKPLLKANPDLQRVLHACIQLRALHSLDQPTRAHVTVTPDLSAMPKIEDLPAESVPLFEQLLRSIAPDGDIHKLAGEWFTSSGSPVTTKK